MTFRHFCFECEAEFTSLGPQPDCPRCLAARRTSSSAKLLALTEYFGSHELLQHAVFQWRYHRIPLDVRPRALDNSNFGVWMPKMWAVNEMYKHLIIGD